jgi:hypothetical protein
LRFSVGRWDAENWGQRPWNEGLVLNYGPG